MRMSSPSPTSSPAPWPYPRWIAHRGAGTLAPENTLAAFQRGASHGYRMFECDVKLSSDGVPFLLHDDTLTRTVPGAADALGADAVAGHHPWQSLSQLDAGSWHSPAYAQEPLPTLDAIAHFCIAKGCFLNIEIKHRAPHGRNGGAARGTPMEGHGGAATANVV